MNASLFLLLALAAFACGYFGARLVWPRVRYGFWSLFFRVTLYVRYVLPLDIHLVWPLMYRGLRRAF